MKDRGQGNAVTNGRRARWPGTTRSPQRTTIDSESPQAHLFLRGKPMHREDEAFSPGSHTYQVAAGHSFTVLPKRQKQIKKQDNQKNQHTTYKTARHSKYPNPVAGNRVSADDAPKGRPDP